MHLAYPPRKASNPPRFRPRSTRLTFLRRKRVRAVGILLLLLVAGLWLLNRPKPVPPYREHVPSGSPPVVIVTVVDSEEYAESYLNIVKTNRKAYANKHGYEAMVVDVADYDRGADPKGWANIIAIRHALTKYPDCKFVWFLQQNAFIMDLEKSLDEQVAGAQKLESLMVRDVPVVPPDSIIKTFSHLGGDDAHLIISQDDSGLVTNSCIIRNGDWAKFFVETWMDPLYRSYNFEKVERHALEHIVQWHSTILSKLALVPQRALAGYNRSPKNPQQGAYTDGDFVMLIRYCKPAGLSSCEEQLRPYKAKLLDQAQQ